MGEFVDGPGSPARYPLQFGKDVKADFLLDEDYHNLNHGSYGTIPAHMQQKLRHYQALHERRPDHFIRYEYPKLLDENREAIAHLVNAPSVDEVVFVENATVGVNTVLRNLNETWSEDGKDEIIYFSTIYGSCGKTIDYVVDSTYGRVSSREIQLAYPIDEEETTVRFREAIRQSREVEGMRPRIAVFDAVSSVPGIRFPFEAIVQACRELGVLSLVDAAQGVGMIDLDLTALDPDFLVSNCHKWLFVPRSCAVFYVPMRNQHLMRSTLPTSHGYVPRPRGGAKERANPLLPSSKNVFVTAFEYVGTSDNSPYLCVKDAIEWRQEVLGGEERIRNYMWSLGKEGGARVASALGTWVMEIDAQGHSLTDCAMVNVALPLVVTPDEARSQLREGETAIPHREAERIWGWMTKVLVDDYRTFVPLYFHDGRFWARLSAQVYLDLDDFQWAGDTLKALSERVAKKEYDETEPILAGS